MTAPNPGTDIPWKGCLFVFGNFLMIILMMECWHQFRDTEGLPSLLWFIMVFVTLGVGAAANKAARKEIK